MFLIIFEDGEIQSTTTAGEDLLQGADDGLLDVLDVSDSSNPLRYWDGEWQQIEAMGE